MLHKAHHPENAIVCKIRGIFKKRGLLFPGQIQERSYIKQKKKRDSIAPSLFLFYLTTVYFRNASRAITIFCISEVPSPIVHNFASL